MEEKLRRICCYTQISTVEGKCQLNHNTTAFQPALSTLDVDVFVVERKSGYLQFRCARRVWSCFDFVDRRTRSMQFG